MAKIDSMVQDFLAQKKIAVVGVSDKRETGCNLNYKKFKDNGYQVYAVIPGSCPNQFLKPDFGHAMMRGMWRLFGFMGVN
jgi:predicted CoA-binding protein